VAVNSLPPYSVLARQGAEVDPAFHARFDARTRSYRYLIWRGEPSPFLRRYTWRIREGQPGGREKLDLDRMREGAALLVGEHDFRAFCAAGAAESPPAGATSEARGRGGGSTIRRLFRLSVRERSGLIWIDVTASGFLHQMVRIIVGTLVEVALRRREPSEIAAILAARDRQNAGPTAPPHGLFLIRVTY
jgi:tRNA pseudouridine38-40 synthase